MAPLSALRRLEATRLDGSTAMAAQRLAWLHALERAELASPVQVLRLHEVLCYLRAYPGGAAVLQKVQGMLAQFHRRADLRRHREALADSGIAGTAIHYRFFGGQAQWLAARWPQRLVLDRSDDEAGARIAAALPQLLSAAEADALMELKPDGYAALDRLRGPLTDAAFLLQRLAVLPGGSLQRESLSDALDASYVLQPDATTPSRTAACFEAAPRRRSEAGLRSGPRVGRPDLRAELGRAPCAVRRLAPAQGARLADLAQAAMVTRARSLEAFSYADARDAWLVDDGDGLAYGFLGMLPERRHALATLVGGLTLRRGVPIGYLQADIVGRSAALSFNTFDTFRGAEAGYTFARWLAALRHLYGTTSFTIEPYQLGIGNKEGLASGAWWFYYKLGFRPRSRRLLALAAAETRRLARRKGSRTPPATLLALAAEHLYFDLDPARPHPLPQPAALGLAAGAAMSARFGAARETAARVLAEELQPLCGLTGWRGFNADQRAAWTKLAPLAALLNVPAWSTAERQALAVLLRAKGSRSERDYVALCLQHPRFEAAVLQAGQRAAARAGPRSAAPH